VKNLKPVDVAIVGGGFTGLAMAKEISTRTSLHVLVLERGGPRNTAAYGNSMDEVDGFLRYRMMQNPAEETITHRHSLKDTAVPVRQYGSFLPGTGVGGTGEHWGGMSFRFPGEQFKLRTHLAEKHGAGKLPDDLNVQDWGLSYEELEPYYWHAEQMIGVSGKAGNLQGKLIEGGNIFEAPRAQEYPNPPMKKPYISALFEEGTKKLGYHPYPIPGATLSRAYKNPDGVTRPGCAYCGYCERYGCMIGAKAQPTNTLLPVVAKRKNVEIRTGSWVRRILHKDGRATGIQYTDANGEEYFQPAGIVVVGTFTLNNVRLLLLSKIGTPYDPGTRKGSLGRNLTHQVGGGTRVYFDKPLNLFMGAGGLGYRISDFEGANNIPASENLYCLGAINATATGAHPIGAFGEIPPGAANRTWGSEWKKAALEWHDRIGGVGMSGEHLSWRQNFYDLDPNFNDKFGDPLIRFTLDWTDHEFRQREYAAKINVEIARAMGGKTDPLRPNRARYNTISYQSTHIQGGAIMGASPETSVVNRSLQHWDLPNLWVVGASSFPQNASGNPTLTALAVTYLAADALINRYLKHPEKLA
jgi:gluconate 2-dehydrogenase alpha chain